MTASNHDNLPWSEQYRIGGIDWADKDAAASLLEDTKSAVMAQRQMALGDIPVNRAEQIVKASPEWMDYLEKTNRARHAANLAKVKLEYIRMRYYEQAGEEANRRTEMRLT